MKQRRYLPTLAELLDRLTICQLKSVFISENKKEYDKDEIFIAEEDGKVLGLLSWQMRGLPKHQLVSIERIAVLQGPKLQEIGENLFRKAMEEADRLFKSQDLKVRKAFCMIHKDKQNLKEFYESLGFIIEAT